MSRDRTALAGLRSFSCQLRIYERHTANAWLSRMHGLRHAYTQR
jgi:hypothetical protein